VSSLFAEFREAAPVQPLNTPLFLTALAHTFKMKENYKHVWTSQPVITSCNSHKDGVEQMTLQNK